MTNSLLHTEKISLAFGGLKAVSNVDISVHPGEILAIIGPNGAGKTSFFNVITGIYRASEGCIYVSGKKLESSLGLSFWVRSFLWSGLIATAMTFLIYLSELWQKLINEKFVWGQSFDWREFATSLLPTLQEIAGSNGLWILFGFWVVGLIALWTISKEFCLTPAVCSRKGLARTFQNIRLFKNLSVLDNVVLGLKKSTSVYLFESLFLPSVEKQHTKVLEEQALKLLSKVGLLDQKDRLADELSYGKKRRLEIARALASNPKILLLDEPAAGLNPTEGEELSDLINSIKQDGISVVLIEHHMKVVMNISDRIVVLHQGQTLASGTPEEIRNNPAVISAYLGDDTIGEAQ